MSEAIHFKLQADFAQKCVWISWGFSKSKPFVSHGFFNAIFRSVLEIKFLGTSSPSIANYNGLPAGTRALFLCVQLEEEVQQEKEALDLMVNLKEAWANRQTCFCLRHKIKGTNSVLIISGLSLLLSFCAWVRRTQLRRPPSSKPGLWRRRAARLQQKLVLRGDHWKSLNHLFMFRLLFAACWHSLLRNRRMREHRWQKWRELMRLTNETPRASSNDPQPQIRETIGIEIVIYSSIQNVALLTRRLWNHKLGCRKGGQRSRRCHTSGAEEWPRQTVLRCYHTVQEFLCWVLGRFLFGSWSRLPWSQFPGHKGSTSCREESQGCDLSNDFSVYFGVFGDWSWFGIYCDCDGRMTRLASSG